MVKPAPIKIFYSWQSDIDKDINRNAIKNALNNAIYEIESGEIEIVIDEATRNTAGTPHIVDSILNKISSSDIFVCDLTIINKNFEGRKTPNPNVLFELGYAVSILGWNRIIALSNKEVYDNLNDLPFDIEKRRLLLYSVKNKTDKQGKELLKAGLKAGIDNIIRLNPFKNKQSVNTNIKRVRDIDTIEKLFSTLYIPDLINFHEELPTRFYMNIIDYQHYFNKVYKDFLFHIYDQKLNALVKKFSDSFEYLLTITSSAYSGSGNEYDKAYAVHNFKWRDEISISAEEMMGYKEIAMKSEEFKRALINLIKYIKANYLEINLEELSEKASQLEKL